MRRHNWRAAPQSKCHLPISGESQSAKSAAPPFLEMTNVLQHNKLLIRKTLHLCLDLGILTVCVYVVGVVCEVVPIYMPACLMILLWSSDWRGGDGGDVPQPVLTFTRQHRQQHSTTLHNTTNTAPARRGSTAPPAILQPLKLPPD